MFIYDENKKKQLQHINTETYYFNLKKYKSENIKRESRTK